MPRWPVSAASRPATSPPVSRSAKPLGGSGWARCTRHIPSQIRRARRLDPGLRFLWREGIVRRYATRQYRLRATDQVVTLRHRSSDLSCFDEVFVKGIYDMPEPWSLIDRSVRPLRVVDLGANVGLFGLKFLAHHADAEIVAFEPDPADAAVLHNDRRQQSRRTMEACRSMRRQQGWFSAVPHRPLHGERDC